MAKRALLVGINRYKIPGADLRGCVNDVKNLKSALTRYYGFADSNIRTLTDLQATKKAMQSAITGLIGKARAGDVLLLHYSGHGSNVPDRNGDEADRRDEIVCPTDLDWQDPLLDDWLRVQFDKLPAGANLTVIMDCCHSGTITRAIQPHDAKRIERYLPNPLDLLAAESGRRLQRNCSRAQGRVAGSFAARGHCQCQHARVTHYRVPFHADFSRCVHWKYLQRRSDLQPGCGHQCAQRKAHLQGVALPHSSGSEEREV